jgi:hypothetical protein
MDHSQDQDREQYYGAEVDDDEDNCEDDGGGDDDYVEEENDRQHPVSTIHPGRCPPLDLEFMWQIYQARDTATIVPGQVEIVQDAERRRKERMATLRDQGFPTGLSSMMLDNAEKCPVRILLIDNSGTMNADDATMVAQSSTGKIQTTECTRWEALSSCLVWHAEMAAWLQNPTCCRLLKDPGAHIGPQQLGISSSQHYSASEALKRLKQLLRATRPNGPALNTLCEHLEDVLSSISHMVPTLTREDRRLILCIFTDSIPLDEQGNFGQFLSMLRGWPVQVVLRLSTADERVLQFYRSLVQMFNAVPRSSSQMNESRECTEEGNTFDSNTEHGGDGDHDDDGVGTGGGGNDAGLHLSDGQQQLIEERNIPRMVHLQLLGDFTTEIERVQAHNPWLNYGFPLHLCREEGIGLNLVECLSQRPLEWKELLQVAGFIFGVDLVSMFLESSTDQSGFQSIRSKIQQLNTEAGVLWSPIKRGFVPWINLKKLDKSYLRQQQYRKGEGGSSRMLLSRGRTERNQEHKSKSCILM